MDSTPLRTAFALLLSAGLLGCEPTLQPYSRAEYRKTPEDLRLQAMPLHPYPASLPEVSPSYVGGQYGLSVNRLELLQDSGEDWKDLQVWVNETYVAPLGDMPDGKLVQVPFRVMYDAQGKEMPWFRTDVVPEKVEIVREGQRVQVPVRQAD
ncbi:MAG: hypothetical protein ACFCVE_12870 [Phycisphaerae bacterium]